jgi:hypothetical protein
LKYFEKQAGLVEWFQNRLEDISMATDLAKHKYYVYKAGREMDVPRLQLLKHDLSKLKPSAWPHYREYYHGQRTPKVEKTFRIAADTHKAAEQHHKKPTGLSEDPNSELEAFADWWSRSKINSKKPNFPAFMEWIEKNKGHEHIMNMALKKRETYSQ